MSESKFESNGTIQFTRLKHPTLVPTAEQSFQTLFALKALSNYQNFVGPLKYVQFPFGPLVLVYLQICHIYLIFLLEEVE